MEIFTSENFEQAVLGASLPVIVDFSATWCGPCKMMAPVLEKLAEEYSGKVLIGKLDVEENMDIAMKYRVMNVPTLLIFKDGKILNTMVGLQNGNTLKKVIEGLL